MRGHYEHRPLTTFNYVKLHFISVGLIHKSALVLVHTRVFSELELVLKLLQNSKFSFSIAGKFRFRYSSHISFSLSSMQKSQCEQINKHYSKYGSDTTLL